MVGLEVGDAARVMPEDIENIQNSGKSGDMLVKLLLNYRVHYQEEGFSMYDPTAVAYLLAPQMFETKRRVCGRRMRWRLNRWLHRR